MSSTGSSAGREGMYSKLTDTETGHDELHHGPHVGHPALPLSAVRLIPRLSAAGPYRLATICLAALCAILLISIVAVSAHYKNKPQGSGGATLGKQTQEGNMSALTATISQLKQEKERLQKERDDLQAKLAATKAPALVTPAPITCPNDWHLFNKSCYLISRNSRDWPESKSFCESQGAHLAIIHTSEEQTFLWNLLPRGHWNCYWFGITDGETEDEWKWVDGTPVIGGFWEVGEPNNHINEDCGYIVKTHVLERVPIRSWYDAPCSMYLPFICEKEMGAGASTAIPH